MRSKRLTIIISLISAVLLIAIACTTEDDSEGREPTPEFNPTAGGGAAPTATAPPDPTAAPAAAEPTEAPAAPEGPAGDPVNGQNVFLDNGCSACHSTGENRVVGPGLSGVFDRAASRVAGQSAEEYVFTAITDPSSFIVDGFSNAMPSTFGTTIAEDDLQDLIAYLATLN